MAEISKSTFNGAATDDVAAVDVYKSVTPAVRNTYNKVTTAFGQSFDYALSKGDSTLRNIANEDTRYLPRNNNKVPSEEDQLKDILKGGKGKLSGIGKDTKAFLLDSLSLNTDNHSVNVGDGGLLSSLGLSDLNDSDALSSIISDLTNGGSILSVVNKGAVIALSAFAMMKLSQLDLGSALESFLDKIEGKDAKKALRSQPRLIVTPSNIDTVEVYIKKLGANTLLANYPDIPKHVMQQYRFKDGTTPAQYPARLTQLVWVMDALMPTWFMTERNGQPVWNLGVINTASDDALVLLKSNATYKKAAMIAPHYTSRDVRSLMREQYPLIALR